MEIKVILIFKISGESLDSQKMEKPAGNHGSQKIFGAISKYTILVISFFNSTYYDGNKNIQSDKMCDGKCDL